nr:hypothetical protein [Tanacetum cinerariifolium]
MPGPKKPEQAPPLPDFVPVLVYPEFILLEDEILSAEEQPLPTADLPTADSPGYNPESDPEEDPRGIMWRILRRTPLIILQTKETMTMMMGHSTMTRIIVAMIWLRAETPSTSYPPPSIVLPHTRASVDMLRAAAPSTYILAPRSETPLLGTPPLLPIPLPTSSPPLLLPSTSHRADILEVTLPTRKRLCIALGPRFKVGES